MVGSEGRHGKPLLVSVAGAGRLVVVAVDEPRPGPARRHAFPVPAQTWGAPGRHVEADVLYTTGRTEPVGGGTGAQNAPDETARDRPYRSEADASDSSSHGGTSGIGWDEPGWDDDNGWDDDDDWDDDWAQDAGGHSDAQPETWFVKAYQCHTPEQAESLHDHFLRQATDINVANSEIAGPQLTPPWAMAPVYVVRADGVLNRQGKITTQLGAPAEAVVINQDGKIWEWFGRTDQPQRANYFLVLSRKLSNAMIVEPHRSRPGTHELVRLQPMARGLDVCHATNIAHCDIKPENVRVYYTDATPSYVLIDSDAVTRLNSGPLTIRCTRPYVLPDLALRFDQEGGSGGQPVSGVALRAHDRYAFGLVTVAAVAGDAAVDALVNLHTWRPGVQDVLNPVAASAELSRLWPDDRWRPLADELAALFDRSVLYDDQWSTESWIRRIQAVADQAHDVQVHAPPPSTHSRPAQPYDDAIDRVRELLPSPLRREESARAVRRAADQVALELARKNVGRALVLWGGGLALVAILLLVTSIGGR